MMSLQGSVFFPERQLYALPIMELITTTRISSEGATSQLRHSLRPEIEFDHPYAENPFDLESRDPP